LGRLSQEFAMGRSGYSPRVARAIVDGQNDPTEVTWGRPDRGVHMPPQPSPNLLYNDVTSSCATPAPALAAQPDITALRR
jgi:hypothetical protein